jgi:hypothetical protein
VSFFLPWNVVPRQIWQPCSRNAKKNNRLRFQRFITFPLVKKTVASLAQSIMFIYTKGYLATAVSDGIAVMGDGT